MVTKEMIEKINYLAKKQKSEGLTPSEKTEQDALRRAYIDSVKNNLRAQLDCIETTDKHHTNGHSCSCGCSHKSKSND